MKKDCEMEEEESFTLNAFEGVAWRMPSREWMWIECGCECGWDLA